MGFTIRRFFERCRTRRVVLAALSGLLAMGRQGDAGPVPVA